jgi:hypothetical protein
MVTPPQEPAAQVSGGVVPSAPGSALARIELLERELTAERIRRRGVLCILAGMAALEIARFLAPVTHAYVAIFGAVFCLVYVVYGLYLYSTQEPFVRGPGNRDAAQESSGTAPLDHGSPPAGRSPD